MAGGRQDGAGRLQTPDQSRNLIASSGVLCLPPPSPTLHRKSPRSVRPRPPQANAARLLWNCTGTALLALTASDVDATNQSYYGEQKLFFLAADASNECQVPLPKVRSQR